MNIIKKIIICVISMAFLLNFDADLYSKKDIKKKDTTFKKAMRYFYQKKLEMAEILFQEELKENPENGLAYSYLGDIFFSKKRYDGALNLFRKALDLNPDGAKDYFRIGQIYYYKKNGDLAIDSFKESYARDNKLKYAYYHMGLVYLMLKRDKMKTIEHWENYLEIAPEDVQYNKIRRAIELLRDPNFVIPPIGSDLSMEEALHLGGTVMQALDVKAKEKEAGHEKRKTKTKLESIYRDDDL